MGAGCVWTDGGGEEGAGVYEKTLCLPLNFVLNLNFSKKYCC